MFKSVDGRTDGRTDGCTDVGSSPILLAHAEPSALVAKNEGARVVTRFSPL